MLILGGLWACAHASWFHRRCESFVVAPSELLQLDSLGGLALQRLALEALKLHRVRGARDDVIVLTPTAHAQLAKELWRHLERVRIGRRRLLLLLPFALVFALGLHPFGLLLLVSVHRGTFCRRLEKHCRRGLGLLTSEFTELYVRSPLLFDKLREPLGRRLGLLLLPRELLILLELPSCDRRDHVACLRLVVIFAPQQLLEVRWLMTLALPQ
mmetsp:Transcript_80781/g.160513  ORF Transcript_80781/g.160513 Transcript_80781/m.160513 type:complete len:213 (+) Transcript_80781:1274-1912(+)